MDFYFSKTTVINDYEGIHILQDHIGTNYTSPWDDFGYIVKFKVHSVKDADKKSLGYIRLYVNNYNDTSKYLIESSTLITEDIYKINDTLNIDIAISLGLDLDYYKKIHTLYDKEETETILETLCDSGYFYSHFPTYSEWDGFSSTIMRGTASQAILKKGFQLALGRYETENQFSITLDKIAETFEPISFSFDNQRELGKTNINLLVGKNGVGKTHIIKYFSEVITGIAVNQEECPYFHKLIIVAYSPFENFYTKNQLFEQLEKKHNSKNKKGAKRKRLNINEYAYIGFRDDEGDFDIDFPNEFSIRSMLKILEYDRENSWFKEKTRLDTLLEILQLSIDFDSIAFMSKEGEQIEINNKLKLKEVLSRLDVKKGILFNKNGTTLQLSSGQNIYAYMLPAIMAEIEDESLIILDEPELYLHPQLEVGLMNMLKHLLKETSSYAILASHSSIIAREIDRKGVTVLRKTNGNTASDKPTIETYGQSLELVSKEIFDDNLITKPFENELKKYIDNPDSFDISIDDLSQHLGDQALSILFSASSDTDEIEIENID